MPNCKSLNRIKKSRFRLSLIALLFLLLSLSQAGAKLRSQVDRSDLTLGQSLNLMIIIDDFKFKNLSFPFDTADYQVVANSSSTSFQIINGVTSQNKTYTFAIIPKHAGTITLPPATMTDGTETVQTDPITINVRNSASPQNPAQQVQQANPLARAVRSQAPSGSEARAYRENLIARLETNNANPYKNQQVNIKLKIYHRGNLRTLNIAPLSAENFIIRKDETVREYQESYNGLDYLVYELNFVAFPIKQGNLTIPGHEIQATMVEDAVMPSNFFDPFGIMNPFLVDREKTIKTNSLGFRIKELPPGAPKDFTGYVGELAVNNEISSLSVKPGDAITLKTKIYGTGNTKNLKFDLVKNSKLYTSFKDKHKIDEQIESSKQYFETLISTAIVPSRNSGKFIVETKPLISFNPNTGKYEEHGQESFEIEISGDKNGSSLSSGSNAAGDEDSSLTQSRSGSGDDDIINISQKQIDDYHYPIYENPQILFLIFIILNLITLIMIAVKKSLFQKAQTLGIDKFSQARKAVKQAGSVADLSKLMRNFMHETKAYDIERLRPELDAFFLESDKINYGSAGITLSKSGKEEQIEYFKTKALEILKNIKGALKQR